jgi:predicted AAA+ superfamily ATPase
MRYVAPYIKQDLSKKMVFLGGPRQCGKTTLAQSLLGEFQQSIYLNWDDEQQKRQILDRRWVEDNKLIVLDELHKFKRWKSWIKGVYDTEKTSHSFLVTGSARLDVYRRGGDSLLGRYHYWRLHPFTLSEKPKELSDQETFQRLLRYGGFPEPFLQADEREARRWRRDRLDRVVRDDIRDLENIRDIRTLELLIELLRSRVGGSIVIKNLAEDLQVSQPTVKHWLEILERMYLIFLVYPYSTNLPRAVLKPPKVYFYDNADVEGDDGARFENLVATHLLKSLHFLEDRDGYRYQLRYLRDKEGREIDFVLIREKKICELIEVKWSDDQISSSLKYYQTKLTPSYATQIVGHEMRPYEKNSIRVVSALEDLKLLERKSLIGR